jgi:predicted DsbA family dithiol-disulfide isomerase
VQGQKQIKEKPIPNTRLALAAAKWARLQPGSFPSFHKGLFAAHFALGEDLDDTVVIDLHASAAGIDIAGLHGALADGSAQEAITESETIGRKYGVQGPPAWVLEQRFVVGLPAVEFENLAEHCDVAVIGPAQEGRRGCFKVARRQRG